MKGLGMRKAMGYNMSSITNSPVNGLLYVRGKISALQMPVECKGHCAASCPAVRHCALASYMRQKTLTTLLKVLSVLAE